MSLTFYEHADPAVVAKVQLKHARALKPCCLDCGKILAARDIKAGRVCLDHEGCRVRRILAGPKIKPGTSFFGRTA